MMLTADILTSIKTIWNSFSTSIQGKDVSGDEIRSRILNDVEFLNSFPQELHNYIRAFAIVYYWCGNMIPVSENFHPGPADNWIYKLKIILDCLAESTRNNMNKHKHVNWVMWIEKCKFSKSKYKNKKKFINDNYLEDMIKSKSGIKYITSSPHPTNFNSLNKYNVEQLKDNNYELAKEWLINNTKIIIQRSYRIVYQLNGSFQGKINKQHRDNIKRIFSCVFEYAGFIVDSEPSEFLELF